MTTTATEKPGEFRYIAIEQAICPNEACESLIRRECIQAREDLSTGHRVVKAYCRHCDRLWTATFIMRGGVWTIVGRPELITEQAVIDGFKRRLAAVFGEVQANKFQPVKNTK